MEESTSDSKRREVSQGELHVDAAVQALVLEILERGAEDLRTTRGPPGSVAGGELVFDVDVEGRRYTLICRRRHPESARVPLSPREREIVRLVAKGLPNKTIAQVLDISLWTVATHLRRIFSKLGVTSRAAMIAEAVREGVLHDIRQ